VFEEQVESQRDSNHGKGQRQHMGVKTREQEAEGRKLVDGFWHDARGREPIVALRRIAHEAVAPAIALLGVLSMCREDGGQVAHGDDHQGRQYGIEIGGKEGRKPG